MADLRPRQRLRPTSSLPQTTGEFYAEKHGIPDVVHNAIPNVAMRIRQTVGQGRSFERTQSQPVAPSTNAFSTFLTEAEVRADAEWSIRKEVIRSRELQPYASTESVDALSLSPRGGPPAASGSGSRSPPRPLRVLRFEQDGDWAQPGVSLGYGKKRTAEDGGDDDDEEDARTEVDEDENLEMEPELGHSSRSTTTTADEFPSVFASPAITQPELFAAPVLPTRGSMAPPPVPFGRQMKGLPGRTLGKTVSAPVGIGGRGMDVDESAAQEDGFDISEWSKAEF